MRLGCQRRIASPFAWLLALNFLSATFCISFLLSCATVQKVAHICFDVRFKLNMSCKSCLGFNSIESCLLIAKSPKVQRGACFEASFERKELTGLVGSMFERMDEALFPRLLHQKPEF